MTILLDHPLVTGLAPEWATAWGEDGYGVFVALRVGKAEQKLRYIPRGSFWMGSPKTEQGRWENEGPQHLVTLTEGYWLADTPCTQEFWQEVMGNNPSRFQSPKRPVEQVSWDDVQGFLRRLEEKFPSLAADLSTEAQWEHACRAGTTTSIYVGELKILGASNAPLLDEIAWYGGNSGVGFDLENGYSSTHWSEKQYPHNQAGSREVGQKRPNAWGLYDMLGNVWEWCADLWGSYSAEAQIDPGGPEEGLGRVYRGGSWRYHARSVRAACRYWNGPGIRNDNLGFRFSLGRPRSGQGPLCQTSVRHRI